jgi:phosphoenolpyruvate-protein kinase (PTS system EI component)
MTADGRVVKVLANVVGAPEASEALELGAEGAGLIRTELAFLDAPAWPTEEDHRRALAPVLQALRGRPATVRVLDFGGDKTPPFLRGTAARGLALLLESPDALAAQLRAALAAGGDCERRSLLPMVGGPDELTAAAQLLDEAVAALGCPRPLLGAMVETPAAAAVADALAAGSDFLSIGTNDLTHATVGTDRFGGGEAHAHDPRVLAHIASCARAAHAAGRFLEVCGEAASTPVTLPLLVGLDVDELSVGVARVGVTRAAIRALRRDRTGDLAERALAATDAAAFAELVEPVARELELLERGEAVAEDVGGGDRVGAVRA